MKVADPETHATKQLRWQVAVAFEEQQWQVIMMPPVWTDLRHHYSHIEVVCKTVIRCCCGSCSMYPSQISSRDARHAALAHPMPCCSTSVSTCVMPLIQCGISWSCLCDGPCHYSPVWFKLSMLCLLCLAPGNTGSTAVRMMRTRKVHIRQVFWCLKRNSLQVNSSKAI